LQNLDFKMSKMQLIGKPQGCAAWSCDQFRGMFVYSFNWRLPKDFTCEQCKLQLYYLTASRCWPPCQQEPCKKPVDYEYCGKPGATYPEEVRGFEFENADVITLLLQPGRCIAGVPG
jgi:hypothetical protein